MRLIDANVVVKKIEDEIKTQCKPVASSHKGLERFLEEVLPMLLRDVINYINQQPTVDAVVVVRCKDCKHAHLTIGSEVKYCDMWSNGEELYLPPDFHCAAGERRSDNATD